MEEDIEHKIDILNIVQERDFNKETCEYSYIEAVLLGIETVLNELERLQKENALNSEKTVHTCLHCGNDTPLYCEKCQQELISKNAELQSDNYEIKNTYRRTAQHLNNIGKTELADYMLAQINDVPVWCVGDDKNFIPKQVVRNKIEEVNKEYKKYTEKWEKLGMNKEHPFYRYIVRLEAQIDILEELLGE